MIRRPWVIALLASFAAIVVIVSAVPAARAAPPGSEYGFVTVTGEPLPELVLGLPDDAEGLAAPSLAGASYAGRPVRVEPATDGPTMLVFMAHWCSHCNVMIDRLAEWRRSGDMPKDVRVVGISTAVQPDGENFPPSQWIVENDWRWPLIADDEFNVAFDAYGGQNLTMTVFLDADGTVFARMAGEVPLDVLQSTADEISELD